VGIEYGPVRQYGCLRIAGEPMALIVFFRGINVGGHKAFRPSVLAKELVSRNTILSVLRIVKSHKPGKKTD